MDLGFQEILVVGVVALLVFGPDKLPELARQGGKLLARLRREVSGSMDELKRAADIQDLERELKSISQDLRDVKSSVGRTLTEPAVPARADDAPPPTDPDAT